MVQSPLGKNAYFTTKARGEAIVERSGLRWTILRPGLVYGPGDDMMTNLVHFVRLAPLFPVPGGPPGRLAVVDVEDVADALACCLSMEDSIGRHLDVVGPEESSLREVVANVSKALDLPTWAPAIPLGIMRPIARILASVLPKPPVTPTQLDMLVAGLYGNHGHTYEVLGHAARPLGSARIRELAAAVETPRGSLRPAPGPAHQALLEESRGALGSLRWFIPLALVLELGGPWVLEHIWLRMLAINVVLATLALRTLPLPWRKLLHPSLGRAGLGALAGGVMGAVAFGVLAVLLWAVPGARATTQEIFSWASRLPPALALPTLCVIALAEDIVWRAAITLPLARRLGAWPACLVAGVLFGLAHLASGPPLLAVVALLAGVAWSALMLRSRSLVTATTCHILWDVALVLGGPLL